MFGLGWGLEPRTAGNSWWPEYMSIGKIADESTVGGCLPLVVWMMSAGIADDYCRYLLGYTRYTR
jgi:hypothetical protein